MYATWAARAERYITALRIEEVTGAMTVAPRTYASVAIITAFGEHRKCRTGEECSRPREHVVVAGRLLLAPW
jgi:hypothetical protein